MSQGGEAGLDLKYRNTSLTQKAVEGGIMNAVSYLEAQSDALMHISSLLDRMGELVVAMKDSTKSPTDLDNYFTDNSDPANPKYMEFNQLRTEIAATRQRQFNGIDLMYVTGLSVAQNVTVLLDERGEQTMDVTQTDFTSEPFWDPTFMGNVSNPASIDDNQTSFISDVSTLTDESMMGLGVSGIIALQDDIAKRIAQNAAEQSRLNIALDHLRQRSVDYDQAGSRIFDTDVAEEVTNLARRDILLHGVVASRIQSNVLSDVALRVMGG